MSHFKKTCCKASWRLIHYICWGSAPYEVIKYIIDKGADLEVITGVGQIKPIHFIIRYCTSDALKYILDKNVSLDGLFQHDDDNENTISYHLLTNHTLEIIKYFIDKKLIKKNYQSLYRLLINPNIIEIINNKKDIVDNFMKLLE